MVKKFLTLTILLASFLGATTIEQIKSSGVIRIGVRDNFPPFGKKNDDGIFEGFEVNLAKAIVNKIFGNSVKIEFSGIKLGDRVDALTQNRLDMVLALFSKKKEREAKVDFSLPYLSEDFSVLSHKDSGIKKMGDLNDKKILFIPGTEVDKFLDKARLNVKKVECANNADCLSKLDDGSGDAFIRTNITLFQLTLLSGNYKVVIPTLGAFSYIGVGMQKNSDSLKEAVNNAILALSKEGFFKKEYDHTFEPFYKGTLDKKYILLDDLYNSIYSK